MLSMENTEGFTQEELDEMNGEVEVEMEYKTENDFSSKADYEDTLQYAEEKVLKKHGGA